MASNPEIQELATEIDECAAGAFSGGRTNNLTDLALSIGAIAASAIAAILVADGKSFPLFTAFVAALPALATALQQTVDFRGRATWYFIKSAQLQELSLNLKYGGIVEIREAARLFGEIERRMEERWVDFVKPVMPKNSHHAAQPNQGTTSGEKQ